jgi:phage terminase large subunit-like protein
MGEERYYFDEKTAQAAVDFFPRYLRLTTGEWAGKPFHLAPHQAYHIGQIFGWKRKEDKLRRYRRVRWWEPRKNGKTETAAGVGHLLGIADGEPGAQIFSHATDGNQADISFKRGANMVQFSPELSELYEVTDKGMFCPAIMSSWRPLSGIPRGKHGLSPHGLIGDEAHEWKDSRLHTFLVQGMGARRQPLDFIISTAGERSGYGWELWNTSLKIRDKIIDDPETYVVIYAADQEDDWTDPKIWAKANPNLGTSLKLSYLEDQCKQAKESPRLENDFKRYHLNLWVEQAVRWLPMDHWKQCSNAETKQLWPSMAERLKGRSCFGGLDLAQTRDITALVWWFPETETEAAAVLCRFWVPEETVALRVRRDRVPYDQWVKDEALFTTPGNVTDYRAIKAQIEKDVTEFKVESLAIDRWNATQLAVELQEDGMNVVLYGQGMASMASPSKELERLVLSHGFDHGQHPVLGWMAANAAVQSDAAGNIKPAKDKSTEKIDGIVALIMGIGLATAGAEEKLPQSPWDDPAFKLETV